MVGFEFFRFLDKVGFWWVPGYPPGSFFEVILRPKSQFWECKSEKWRFGRRLEKKHGKHVKHSEKQRKQHKKRKGHRKASTDDGTVFIIGDSSSEADCEIFEIASSDGEATGGLEGDPLSNNMSDL